jgi:hypothetical protein
MDAAQAIERATRFLADIGYAVDSPGQAVRIDDEEPPHWAVSYIRCDPPGVATSPGGPIVMVYDSGDAALFEVM